MTGTVVSSIGMAHTIECTPLTTEGAINSIDLSKIQQQHQKSSQTSRQQSEHKYDQQSELQPTPPDQQDTECVGGNFSDGLKVRKSGEPDAVTDNICLVARETVEEEKIVPHPTKNQDHFHLNANNNNSNTEGVLLRRMFAKMKKESSERRPGQRPPSHPLLPKLPGPRAGGDATGATATALGDSASDPSPAADKRHGHDALHCPPSTEPTPMSPDLRHQIDRLNETMKTLPMSPLTKRQLATALTAASAAVSTPHASAGDGCCGVVTAPEDALDANREAWAYGAWKTEERKKKEAATPSCVRDTGVKGQWRNSCWLKEVVIKLRLNLPLQWLDKESIDTFQTDLLFSFSSSRFLLRPFI